MTHFFWFVMYFCHGKQLCLAVSLISTAANSAWNGELGDKCRQRCAETVVGWREGTNGTGKGCRVYTSDARLVSHDCIFFSGWFIKAQHLWCPRNQVSGLRCLFYYSSMPLKYCAWSNMWTLVVCHIGRDTARLLGRNVRSPIGWRSFLEVVGSHWVKELQMICAPSDFFGVWISVT